MVFKPRCVFTNKCITLAWRKIIILYLKILQEECNGVTTVAGGKWSSAEVKGWDNFKEGTTGREIERRCLMKECTERGKLTKDVQSEQERERDGDGVADCCWTHSHLNWWGYPGDIPKLECPREVITSSSKKQSASERDDVAYNFVCVCVSVVVVFVCLWAFCLEL